MIAAHALLANGGQLMALPWIGDGLPDRNGADWYEEDPAPEFKAEFVLPPGVTETKIHFVCAGFGSFSLDGSYMNPDGLDTLWTPYDKTVYSTTTRTIRVTDATNTVFVRLGNGFYNLPPLRFWGHRLFREVVAHGRPCFKMAIDGVERPLEWRWRKTNVVRNSVYLGTEIDATRPARSMSSRRRPARSSAATVGRARRMSPASATRMSAAARRASASRRRSPGTSSATRKSAGRNIFWARAMPRARCVR